MESITSKVCDENIVCRFVSKRIISRKVETFVKQLTFHFPVTRIFVNQITFHFTVVMSHLVVTVKHQPLLEVRVKWQSAGK